MRMRGRLQQGVVVLDGGLSLPEGAAVYVVYPAVERFVPVPAKRRVELPLVRCENPGSVALTNQQIAEILDAEDAAP